MEAAVPKTGTINPLCLKVVPYAMPTDSQLVLRFGERGTTRYEVFCQPDRCMVFTAVIQVHDSEQLLILNGTTISQ